MNTINTTRGSSDCTRSLGTLNDGTVNLNDYSDTLILMIILI